MRPGPTTRWTPLPALALLALGCQVEVLMPAQGVSRAPELAADTTEDASPAPDPALLPTFYIASIEPAEAPISGGVRVTLNGNRFTEPLVVRFGDAVATGVVFQGEARLLCDAPPHPAGWVDVTVQRGDGLMTSLADAFRYRAEVELDSVAPSALPARGGAPIELRGRGFSADTQVLVGGRLAPSVVVESGERLHAVVPDGPPGPADVFVVAAGGFARARDAVRFVRPPRVELAVPPAAPLGAPALVHLVGEGLDAVDSVRIGGRDGAIVERWGDDTLAVWIEAPSQAGVASVEVASAVGVASQPRGFAWLAPSGAPAAYGPLPGVVAASGGPVAVAVSGASPGHVEIEVDGAPAEGVAFDPHLGVVWFDAPAGSPGGAAVVTVQVGGQALPLDGGLSYAGTLRLDAITPEVLPASGGTLRLLGEGLGLDAEVWIGGRPAPVLAAPTDAELVVSVPASLPRRADVTVRRADRVVTRLHALDLVTDTLGALASAPSGGSIAGGSYLRVFGYGFTEDTTLEVGGAPASGVVVHGGTLLTAYAPKGALGPAAVVARREGTARSLDGAFTYYEPTTSVSGAWGEPVDESVNLSVIEAGSGRRVAGAFAMLRASADSPYIGATDADGLITFGGPGLRGPQTVTAAKAGYVSASVVAVDATNITLALTPYVPPPQGNGADLPPPSPLGRVSGKVIGIDKYIPPELGQCEDRAPAQGAACSACPVAGVCAAGLQCVPLIGQGPRCLAPCGGPSDCAPGWYCTFTGADAALRCLPSAGTPYARCETSTSVPGGPTPEPGPGAEVAEGEDGSFRYDIVSRLGELAVRCEAGLVDFVTGQRQPRRWGFTRHVVVPPGAHVEDVDVELQFPLDGALRLVLDDPPQRPGGPDLISIAVFLELGTDGYFAVGTPQGLDPRATYEVPSLPVALSGVLQGAAYSLWGGTFTKLRNAAPLSVVFRDRIDRVGSAGLFVRDEAGVYQRTLSPGLADLQAIHGVSQERLWAVGDRGTILAYVGNGWSPQPGPAGVRWRGVFTAAEDRAFAVGGGGELAHFDGVSWKAEASPTTRPLRAVWADREQALAAGWFEVLRREGGAWERVVGAPQRDWWAAWGGAGQLWLGGAGGEVARFDGTHWHLVPTPLDGAVRGLWGASAGAGTYVVAVGDDADLAEWDGAGWSRLPGPDGVAPLHAVWGRVTPTGVVLWVAAEDGYVHRLEGGEWHRESVHEEGGVLSGVYVPPDSDRVFAVGAGAVRLGPFMRVPRLPVAPAAPVGAAPVRIELEVDDGVAPHFRYAVLSETTGLPLWAIVARGDRDVLELPNLPLLTGLPGVTGGPRTLLLYSAYRPGFLMDAYSSLDLRQNTWRSWSVDQLTWP